MSFASDLVAQHRGQPLLMRATEAVGYANRLLRIEPTAFDQPRRLSAFFRGVRQAGRRVARQISGESEGVSPSLYCPAWADEDRIRYSDFGLTVLDGVALLNVDTPIVAQGFSWCGDWYHGYDTIEAALRTAFADPDVEAVFLRMHSPGGVIAGGLDSLTALLKANREAEDGKAVWLFADMACSAAYWVGCWADRIVAPRAGVVGSVGAVIVHVEYADHLAREGVTVTAFESGKMKLSGADFRELSDEDADKLQALVDDAAAQFFANVAEARPDLTPDFLAGLQAEWFTAEASDPARSGLALGLVDAIGTEAETFAALVAETQAAGTTPATPAAVAATVTPAKETDMAKRGTGGRTPAAKPSASGGKTVQISARELASLTALAAKAMEDEELETDPEEEEVETDPEDPETETDPEEEEVETDPEDPETETDPEDPEGEGEDEEVETRAVAFAALPGAQMLSANYIRSLAANPKISLKGAKALIAKAANEAKLNTVSDHPVRGSRGGGNKPANNSLAAGLAFAAKHGRIKKAS